jgi:serine/threonine-protein kinase
MALEKIGPYKIQGILGRGGMGTVYRGRHEKSDELHAIKVLSPNFADDEHFRGRFESEIQALLKLDHENIVSILSFGQEDGQLFFSMELVDGNSLYQMRKAGHQFDWRQIIAVARDCANGLRHAHDRGIIHRDLKPGNLLMACDDNGIPEKVKLTDFGIAKSYGNSQNTGTNILGTMDFMSPEQAKGEPVTARSDLYSLGAVLYTLLAGRPPFTSNGVEEALRNLTRVPAPRISAIAPSVPPALDDLISKLMAKKPEDRIPTALALLHKLQDIENELRDDSEAMTAHGAKSDTSELQSRTESAPATLVDDNQNRPTGVEQSDKLVANQSSLHSSVSSANPTREDTTDGSLSLAPEEKTRVDYFSPVTESIRKRHTEVAPAREPKPKGLIPLILALIGVILLGWYGWVRATAPPSAEKLMADIEAKSKDPDRSLRQINLFLKHYPDEPRAESVANLKTIGEAIRRYRTLVNTLTVRAKSPAGLTGIEEQFLELANIASDDPDSAAPKMKAFANFNQQFDLPDKDQTCVDAARAFAVKLRHDKRSKVLTQLSGIRSVMHKASQIEEPDKAITLYRSIHELYKDVNWAMLGQRNDGPQLLAQTQAEISRLENVIRMKNLEAEQQAADAEADPAAAGDAVDAGKADEKLEANLEVQPVEQEKSGPADPTE